MAEEVLLGGEGAAEEEADEESETDEEGPVRGSAFLSRKAVPINRQASM